MKDRTTQLPASTHMWINFFLFWKLKNLKLKTEGEKYSQKRSRIVNSVPNEQILKRIGQEGERLGR